MKKQFDTSTAKKIISEYADKINFYMKQNETLKSQMEDMTTTLNINKNILYKQLLDNPNCKDYSTIINELKNENERISQRNTVLNIEKEALESKLLKIQSEYDEKFLNEKSEFEKLSEEIFILQQKLKEKEGELFRIKREAEIKSFSAENIKEILVADPTKINLELNNELNSLRDIMSKLTKMLNAEKSKNEKLEKKYQQTLGDYEELKQNYLESSSQSENEINEAKGKTLKENAAAVSNFNGEKNKLDFESCVLNKKPMEINKIPFNAINKQKNYKPEKDVVVIKNNYKTEQLNKKLELSFESNDSISSSNSDSSQSGKSDNGSIEMKFPDKVQMEKDAATHNKSNSLIPKLDFTKVQEKYNNENMKQVHVFGNKKNNNDNKIIKTTTTNNNNDNNKIKDDAFEKEKKSLVNKVQKLKAKIDKYKSRYKDLKEKFIDLKVKYKLSNNKINFLETQIKRNSNIHSTGDLTNKRLEINADNVSMNQNLSDICIDDGKEFEDNESNKTEEKEEC